MCCHVSYGKKPGGCFSTALKERLPLWWLWKPSVMKKWCLTFHTWCLTCLQEREYFFLYHSFFVVVLIFFPFSAHLDPCCAHHQACTRHEVSVFVYCVMPACVHTFPLWNLWNVCLFFFLFLVRPHVRFYEWFVSPFFKKMAKCREDNMLTSNLFVLSDTEVNIFLFIT